AFLTDFDQAEHIKYDASKGGNVSFTDIMGLDRKTTAKEVEVIVKDTVKIMTRETSDQIKKLNGGKPVSAIFVVGGGGKMPGYTESLAEEMGIDPTRVAVRGEDVLKNIDFKDKSLPADSLLVTPIGICLNFFRQRNNFIFVSFNDVQYKLYDNNKLKVMDAAVQAGFANADLFPKRGAEIAYTINGEKRVVRGETGEGAQIKLNGDEASLNASIKAGDAIEVQPSTAGAPAHLTIEELPEFTESLKVVFNGSEVEIPKYAEVNGALQSGYYEVRDGDEIIMRNYVTVSQLLSFLDVKAEKDSDIMINHEPADSETKVYENFTVELLIDDTPHEEEEYDVPDEDAGGSEAETPDNDEAASENTSADAASGNDAAQADTGEAAATEPVDNTAINVIVNDENVTLTGKTGYVFVDVFDHIDFDLSKPHGKMVITKKNGMRAEYSERIKDGDRLEIYWEK
ncbi:MAG: cell division protein FtsA, partial [Lachnospiraceae bacterium]|nr:cell division protein FtsA [Lachnospiraceae bacterium]